MKPRTGPGPLPGVARRVGDERLVTGNGSFVADRIPPGALHASFVRSLVSCGTIIAVDASEAAGSPGVAAVFTAGDLGLSDLSTPPIGGGRIGGMAQPMLARDRVTYVGEPVAVVLAESAPLAEDAAGMVVVDIEPGEPVLAVSEAVTDRILVHPDAGTNVVLHDVLRRGPEPEPEGLIEVSVSVDHPRLAPSPLETLGVLAVPIGDGLHVHAGVQSPHQLREQLAGVLGLDVEGIRVSVPDVGGAFGMKRFYPEYAVIAAAALRLNRPVAWVQPRRESFSGGTHGRGQHHEVTLSATVDGRIQKASFVLETDTGAYPHRGAQIGFFSRLVATGLYDIPCIEFELRATVTNLPPTAPYRGAGRPEAALAIERAVDALAGKLGLDPAELRRRNLVSRLPYTTPTGAVYDSGDYGAALERALQMSRYDEVRREQAECRRRGGNPIGIGIGAFIERAGGAPDSWEYGAVEIAADGVIVARTGSTSAGQGHETVWRKVVAEAFDLDPRSVVVHAGDTAEVPDSVGSFASRSAQIGASAVWRCAEQVRLAAARVAADVLEASPADLVVSNGAFHVAGVPDRRVTLADVARVAGDRGIELRAEERYTPGVQTFPYGVHVAVVEVDLDTGRVIPRHLVAVDDVGTVLDEVIVTGQVHGSVVQGIGAALLEEMRYDGSGQPMTTTFMDYLIPSTSVDAPLSVAHLSHPAPSNPLGAKGAGEGGCIGIPPAIVNATLDALAPWGVTELQIPLTPEKIWHALQEARRVTK